MSKWDTTQCIPEQDLIPEWALKQMGDLLEKHNTIGSLVEVAMGFDLWFLPKDMVLGMFDALRRKGLRLVTTHVGQNAFMGESLTNNLSKTLIDSTDRPPIAGTEFSVLRPPPRSFRSHGLVTRQAVPCTITLQWHFSGGSYPPRQVGDRSQQHTWHGGKSPPFRNSPIHDNFVSFSSVNNGIS